jgi:hypothetical protein
MTWWKYLFTNPANIIGIAHGIFVGMMLSRVHTVFLKLLVIMGPCIVIVASMAAVYHRRGMNNSDIESKMKTYGFHAILYGSLVDGLVTHDSDGIIAWGVFAGVVYILLPVAYGIILRCHLVYIPRYVPDRNLDVSGDYSPLDLELQQENCTICLEPLETDVVKLTNCSHTYHEKCITEWLVRKRECPVCRQYSEAES